MIDKNKQYRTRDGREVRIYAVDGLNGCRVHGAIRHPEYGWEHRAWFADGRMYSYPSDSDLIEVRPRIKREVWVNVYPDGVSMPFLTKEAANNYTPMAGRIACVKLVIDCEEGEGL
jgi:hypothetical protein